ncbi:MAG: LPS export ABC transporter periplasmic protein LptC [Flavobacteriales bacterium]|nr:MAG: LPS export ABC transporter periplasmic protein LptC [Flavobacteriales bacterium]
MGRRFHAVNTLCFFLTQRRREHRGNAGARCCSAFSAPLRETGFLLLALFLFSACKNDLDSVAAVDLHADGPDRTSTEVEYFYSDSAIVRNRLRAARVEEYMTKPERTELSGGIELVFFTASGAEGSKLTAQRGTIRNAERLMRVAGDVVFVNTKGETLRTEELHWVQDSAIIRTDKPVTIERKQDVIHGQGMRAAEDFSRYEITRITGVVAVQKDSLENTP